MSIRAQVADGRRIGVLSRDDIITALREYGALYGSDFPQSAFSPSQAKRNGRPELVDRYYAPRADGRRWPSLNAIKDKFGTWNEARAAAGFEPNSTGPMSGRRKAGEAEPILTVRERLVYVPSEKTKEAVRRAQRLQERLNTAVERTRRAEQRLADLKAEVRTVRPATVTETKVKTVTKTVKVRDKRAVERARARLADSEAARRAVEDQLKSQKRDYDAAIITAREAEAEAFSASQEARESQKALDRANDRAVAAEAVSEGLKAEIEMLAERVEGSQQAAVEAGLVRRAESRVEQAEIRAARAEREMAEQAEAITGQQRRLTVDELNKLRATGPAGPGVLAKALKHLAYARSLDGSEMEKKALGEVASAAVMWRDRIR